MYECHVNNTCWTACVKSELTLNDFFFTRDLIIPCIKDIHLCKKGNLNHLSLLWYSKMDPSGSLNIYFLQKMAKTCILFENFWTLIFTRSCIDVLPSVLYECDSKKILTPSYMQNTQCSLIRNNTSNIWKLIKENRPFYIHVLYFIKLFPNGYFSKFHFKPRPPL